MIKNIFESPSGKNILLLQGPVGPFFKNLSEHLKKENASVVKVNFNGGDLLFYPDAQYNFKGRLHEWHKFIDNIIVMHKIDTILLFGQNRIYHDIAIKLIEKYTITLGVFEEGYVRPNYITLEKWGVNHQSSLPKDPLFYLQQPAHLKPMAAKTIKHAFLAVIVWAMLYYVAAHLLKPFYKYYDHHRRLSVMEVFPWIRAFYRKYLYAYLERDVLTKLIESYDQAYFLAPLQVHNDAQIKHFEKLDDIEHFIQSTMYSFSKYASTNHILVFKHHPLDRGYTNYSAFIDDLSRQYRLQGRVIYVHDLHLPSLLTHARGVVVVNSTSGMQALFHQTPTKVIADTVYNLKGLTYQKPLHQFWKEAHKYKPDQKLYQKFSDYLISHTQLNGSFYKRIKTKEAVCGLISMRENSN